MGDTAFTGRVLSYRTNAREAFIAKVQEAIDRANDEAAKAGFINLDELDVGYAISCSASNWCAILTIITEPDPPVNGYKTQVAKTFIGWSHG